MDKKTTATIRERGQLTIPAEVRKQAQLDEGAIVEFEVRGDGVLLRPRLVIADLDLDDAFIRDVIASTTAGYETLREDGDQWGEELAERAVLEGALPDALGDE
jgi:AbrB family looped-hinge helix DNA binding protein